MKKKNNVSSTTKFGVSRWRIWFFLFILFAFISFFFYRYSETLLLFLVIIISPSSLIMLPFQHPRRNVLYFFFLWSPTVQMFHHLTGPSASHGAAETADCRRLWFLFFSPPSCSSRFPSFFPSHSIKTIFNVSYLHRGQLSVDQVDSTISGGCVFVIGSVFCAGSRLATILPLLTVCRNLCFMIICCCAIISCTTKSCALPYRQPSRWRGG